MLVLCVLFWSGNFILGRFIKDELAPIQLSFFRWFGVLILLVPYILIKHKQVQRLLTKHFPIMLLLSLLGVSGFNTLLYKGLQQTSATNALLINSSIPVLIIIFSALILKKPISLLQGFGVLISMGGVIFLALNGELSHLITLEFNQGDLWVITAAFLWAFYSVLLYFKPKDSEVYFATSVLLGATILWAIHAWQGYSVLDFMQLTTAAKLVITYTVLLPSIASFYLWHQGIAIIGASKTGQFTHLMPVFGILLASIFLNEQVHFYHLVGITLVGIGIYISLFVKK